jgi:hypothetical protein
MDYRIEDDFDVSAERYWDVFFSDEYNTAMWAALDIEHQLLSLEREGEGDSLVIRRKQQLTPKREVPALIAKFVKGAITYREENVFTKSNDTMKTVTISNILPDKIVNTGVYRLETLGPNKVRRVWEGICQCKVPLLGGKVEKMLVGEVQESYRRATEFTRKWHAEHPA